MKKRKSSNWWDFCEWIDKKANKIILIAVIIGILGGYIFCGGIEVFNAYDEREYEFINNVVDNVVIDEKFDFSTMPEAIKYDLTCEADEYILSCYLDKDKIYDSPSVTIKLSSDNFEVLSKYQNYNSRRDFIISNTANIIFMAVLLGGYPSGLVVGICVVGIGMMSDKHKKISL